MDGDGRGRRGARTRKRTCRVERRHKRRLFQQKRLTSLLVDKKRKRAEREREKEKKRIYI